MRRIFLSASVIALLGCCCFVPTLFAQDIDDGGHGIALEIGPAAEWALRERPNFGASVTCEVTAIPNWLELEFGFSALATSNDPELEAELLFEKPFQLSDKVEFMLEVGPSLSRELESNSVTSLNLEFAIGIFFWPQSNLGWYVESGWSDTPKSGRQSMSAGVGVLVPIGGD